MLLAPPLFQRQKTIISIETVSKGKEKGLKRFVAPTEPPCLFKSRRFSQTKFISQATLGVSHHSHHRDRYMKKKKVHDCVILSCILPTHYYNWAIHILEETYVHVLCLGLIF